MSDTLVCKMIITRGKRGRLEGPWPSGYWQGGIRSEDLPPYEDFRYWARHEGKYSGGSPYFGLHETYGDMEIVPEETHDPIQADESFRPGERPEMAMPNKKI